MQKISVGLWIKNFTFNFKYTKIISKQAIKLRHILKVNFAWKFEYFRKKCFLHSENIY